MTDIVERLKRPPPTKTEATARMQEAATEIERLREALAKIAAGPVVPGFGSAEYVQIARAALPISPDRPSTPDSDTP